MMKCSRFIFTAALTVSLALGAIARASGPTESLVPQAAKSPAEEVVVTATGHGADPASAKLDATREALRQAVGTFVDVKSVVEGDKLVSDRILSATSALVIASKVVEGPTRRGDGTYEVKCEVKIRKHNLVGALTEAGFKITGAIDGDAAKRVSEINFANAKEAEAILKDRLSNLWSKLMVGRLLDDKGVPLGDGELPTVVQQDDGTVVVCANIQLYFHLEAFYTKLVPDMKRLLEALAVSKSQELVNRRVTDHREPEPGSRFGGVPVFSGWYPESLSSGSQTRATIWIPDGRDQLGINEHFSGFEVPLPITDPFRQAAEQCDEACFLIELLNGEGQTVVAKKWPVGRNHGLAGNFLRTNARAYTETPAPIEGTVSCGLYSFLLWKGNSGGAYVLTPRFGMDRYDYAQFGGRLQQVVCDVYETRVHITLPAADLAQVKSYRVVPVEGTPWK